MDPELLAVLTLVAVDCLAAEDALLLATISKFPVGSMIAFMTGEKGKKKKKRHKHISSSQQSFQTEVCCLHFEGSRTVSNTFVPFNQVIFLINALRSEQL